jgi:hypothetical protein
MTRGKDASYALLRQLFLQRFSAPRDCAWNLSVLRPRYSKRSSDPEWGGIPERNT